jgi:hypothetical protein
MFIKLSVLKNSIKAGYLPADFIDELRNGEEIVMTETGFAALEYNTIQLDNGEIYHNEKDDYYFVYDEINKEYICESEAVTAYGRHGNEYITRDGNNIVSYRGNNYISEYLSDNEIVFLHDGELCHENRARYVESEGEFYREDDVYFWESDGEYHLDPEEEEEVQPQKNTLWGYDQGPKELNFTTEDAGAGPVFGFGIEIEKNALPSFDFDKQTIYDNTGAVMERDGSVSNGFELKTPVYNLMSAKTEERLKPLADFCNIKEISGAGGHIGFSMEGKTDEELLNLCRGFLPLIYAMYKNRLKNHYCEAKPINKLIKEKQKFQSVRLRGHYIEFRIFSAVKSYETVIFRLNLFRCIAKNIGASFSRVLIMAINPAHELNKLLTGLNVYNNAANFERLITDAIEFHKTIGRGRLSQKKIDKIIETLRKNMATN